MNARLPFSDARLTASQHNPLIDAAPTGTLYNAACMADLLARLHYDQAQRQEAEDAGQDGVIDPPTASNARALCLVAETLAAALRFEISQAGGQA
jgi:hypothetical protein